MRDEFLWVEKYRPKTIEECILPESIKKTFLDFLDKGEVPNLLLAGPAGCGKTTVAKALCNELGVDVYVINGSDVFHGVSYGLSSVIRRASEMNHIREIFQIGLRSAGSARPEEAQAALDYGSNLITDIELQEVGMKAILEKIPDGHNYYLTIDADGVDPTIMPAVAGPAPGGVNYSQMRTLIQGLVKKGKVLGMDIVEITPSKDVNGITAITAGRFICNLIGSAVRAGYFKK